jgi:Tfp pilus assembly protein PilF
MYNQLPCGPGAPTRTSFGNTTIKGSIAHSLLKHGHRLSAPFPTVPLIVVLGVIFAPTVEANPDQPIVVHTAETLIDYEVPTDARPLTSVQLWYTTDRGATWTAYGYDEDLRSPLRFVATNDGLYGIFLVLENATGPSSQPPTPRTEPHLWLLVDQQPPVVQLHPLRQTTSLGQPTLQIRWTAIDMQFGPRPIELEYRTKDQPDWRSLNEGPLGNTGRYDWTLPDGLTGHLEIRVAARDLAGQRSVSEPQSVVVTPFSTYAEPVRAKNEETVLTVRDAQIGDHDAMSPALSGSTRARQRAAQLIEEAITRRDRGDERGAIARLRQAVQLDPRRTDAFAELAALFYRLGDWERALEAYEIVLKQQPRSRSALLGSALTHTQKKNYSAAGEHLRTILRHNPNDAEVWMNLGDVAIYSGDEVLARDCYSRASQIDPAATEVVENARRRLAFLNEVSSGRGGR